MYSVDFVLERGEIFKMEKIDSKKHYKSFTKTLCNIEMKEVHKIFNEYEKQRFFEPDYTILFNLLFIKYCNDIHFAMDLYFEKCSIQEIYRYNKYPSILDARVYDYLTWQYYDFNERMEKYERYGYKVLRSIPEIYYTDFIIASESNPKLRRNLRTFFVNHQNDILGDLQVDERYITLMSEEI